MAPHQRAVPRVYVLQRARANGHPLEQTIPSRPLRTDWFHDICFGEPPHELGYAPASDANRFGYFDCGCAFALTKEREHGLLVLRQPPHVACVLEQLGTTWNSIGSKSLFQVRITPVERELGSEGYLRVAEAHAGSRAEVTDERQAEAGGLDVARAEEGVNSRQPVPLR